MLLASLLLYGAGLSAQEMTVRGVVTGGSDGQPVAGASVVVKGSVRGTTTDASGTYALDVAADDVLVVSFLGYKTQEVNVAGRTAVDVRLQEEAELVDEVVVIGYGTMKKSDLTGERGLGEGFRRDAGFVGVDRQAAPGTRRRSDGDRQFERQSRGRRDGPGARHQFHQRVQLPAGGRGRSSDGRRRKPQERQSGHHRVDRSAERRFGHGDLRFARRQRRHHDHDQKRQEGASERLVLGQGRRGRFQRSARLLARSGDDGPSGERVVRERRRRRTLHGQDMGRRDLLPLRFRDRKRRMALSHPVGRLCVPDLRYAGLQRGNRRQQREEPLLCELGVLRRRGHAAQRRLREVHGRYVVRQPGGPQCQAEDQGGIRAGIPDLQQRDELRLQSPLAGL